VSNTGQIYLTMPWDATCTSSWLRLTVTRRPCRPHECKRMGSLKTLAALQAAADSESSSAGFEVATVKCLGECGMGPNVQIHGDDGERNGDNHIFLSNTTPSLVLGPGALTP
jgi:hypothetical protein